MLKPRIHILKFLGFQDGAPAGLDGEVPDSGAGEADEGSDNARSQYTTPGSGLA